MADRIPENFAAVRSTIKDWLVEAEVRYTPLKLSNSVWGYSAENDDQVFMVYQMSGQPEKLMVALIADLSDYEQLISKLSAQDRRALLFEIRFALLAVDVEFNIPNDELKAIQVERQIFLEDGLTRTVFWDKVYNIHKAMLAILWAVERRCPLE
jgi:hypothetical protein